jgi:hypothetical protein
MDGSSTACGTSGTITDEVNDHVRVHIAEDQHPAAEGELDLLALPFAVRCRACEDTREQEQRRVQRLTGSTVSLSLFPEALSS